MTASFELTQTDHLLTTTRAVRKRLDLARPVETDVRLDCIQMPPRRRAAATRSGGGGWW
jgi:hypothetical protein